MKAMLKLVFSVMILIVTNISISQAALRSYDVEGIFYEPMTQNIGNTIFTGTFSWDSGTNTLSNLQGVMNSSMYSMDQNISLTNNQIQSMNGSIVTASVFLNPSSVVFATGGYDANELFMTQFGVAVAGWAPNPNPKNAVFTFSFDTSGGNVSAGDVSAMQYADCTDGGMMSYLCMTGVSTGGTMSGNPLSLTISEVSAVPVPAAAWLFGGALVSLIGANRRKNVLRA